MNEHASATTANNAEPIDSAKKRKSRKVKDNNKPKKERTEQQKAKGFQPGVSGNPSGRPKGPERKNEFRINAETILHSLCMPQLINHMYRDNLLTKDLIRITELMAQYAYGKPKEIEYDDTDESKKLQNIAPIVITRDLLDIARANDLKHFAENNEE